MYEYLHVHVYTCMCIHQYTCIHILWASYPYDHFLFYPRLSCPQRTCKYVCIYVYICIHICIYTYVHMHMYTYSCIYTYLGSVIYSNNFLRIGTRLKSEKSHSGCPRFPTFQYCQVVNCQLLRLPSTHILIH